MPKSGRKVTDKFGLPPGTLIHTGEKLTDRVRITVFDYDEQSFTEKEVPTIEECFHHRETPTVTWINIDGIHDTSIVEKIGRHFNLHPLMLEDILHTNQRPKLDDYADHIYIAARQLFYDEEKNEVTAEQVSIVLGKSYVISLQEREGDVLNPIRDRIRNNKGRVRKMGADYLTYSLIDTLVDSYFIILEHIGDAIEKLEDYVMESADPATVYDIHRHKRNILFMRKSLWPLRDVVNALKSEATDLVQASTDVYIRDVNDHTIQVLDAIELLRDTISGLIDLNMSSASNRMNEVMKVLTLIATIFIPLTFIAGIYGMNFEYMPELGWQWGYFGALGVMAVLGFFMVWYFKSRKWL